MYGAFADPYCYPGTTVLKNIPELRDAKALERYELSLSDQRAREPFPVGRLSVRHYRSIHWHLFRDVYAWAGRFRTIRIAKEQSVFCFPENIGLRRSERCAIPARPDCGGFRRQRRSRTVGGQRHPSLPRGQRPHPICLHGPSWSGGRSPVGLRATRAREVFVRYQREFSGRRAIASRRTPPLCNDQSI